MTRQKQDFLFMFTKRDSLLGLEQELGAQWWDRKKAVEKGCLFATHFLSTLLFFIAFMGRMIYEYEIISLHSQAMAGIANHGMSTNWWACIR